MSNLLLYFWASERMYGHVLIQLNWLIVLAFSVCTEQELFGHANSIVGKQD